MGCIFCKIVEGEIKTEFVYQDDFILAFNDIKPQAPVHIVIIPRIHIEKTQDIENQHKDVLGHIFSVVPKIAKLKNIDKSGYRLVVNCQRDAGQEVFHLHIHLLGGRKFSWPPG